MKYLPALIIVALAVAVSGCTSPRYASTTEYDDVYYSSSDRTEPVAVQQESSRQNDSYSYGERRPVDSYNDTYYDDDDFVFSRRLRRFHQPANRSFRYYDPFYSNDLYFVMGTPTWNRWYNQYGWYNWNNPRFAAPFDPFGPRRGFGWSSFNQPLYGWNSWGNPYYNPYVSAWYGNDPFFGGWNNGWGNYYDPWLYANAGGFYCPPGVYSYNRAGVAVNNNNGPRTVTRRRNATPSTVSQTRLEGRKASTQPTRNNPSVGREANATAPMTRSREYLQPRQPVQRATPAEVQRTVRETRATMPRRSPNNSPSRNGINRTNPRRNSPTINSGRNSNSPRVTPRRNSSPQRVTPKRNSSPQRNLSRPSPSRNSSPSRPSPTIRRNNGNLGGSGNRSNSSSPRRRDNR